ncbi:hypothetical protein AGMMS49921_10030 [Endomicrobiia bacterium]|nr:hypothetical protein AGMMS49921_10030 [Endomicrobiia bacterium]
MNNNEHGELVNVYDGIPDPPLDGELDEGVPVPAPVSNPILQPHWRRRIIWTTRALNWKLIWTNRV